MRGSLGARLRGIDSFLVARDDVIVDAVLGVRRSGIPVEALRIRFIFGEESFGSVLAMEPQLACLWMLECECGDLAGRGDFFHDRLGLALIPGPGIAKPNCR